MTVFRALLDGLGRVVRAPAILAGVYLGMLGLAVPAGLLVRSSIAEHLGRSVAGDTMADGVDADWWDEFSAQSEGLEDTFTPSIIGASAPLGNLSRLADGETLSEAETILVAAHLLLWTFLVGGILDRYARRRPTRSAGFFSACGVYFFRFCRLAVIAAPVYWLVLAVVQPWLLDDLFPRIVGAFTVERNAFVVRLALYGVIGALLVAVNLVFDYAKIRAAVEDRRSMIAATLAALRFIGRHPWATVSLSLLNAGLLATVIAGYAALAPGATPADGPVWTAFVVGQLYILCRLGVHLLGFASQTAYFQSQLAHASYTAAPSPVWQESPAAEAISTS